MTTRLFCRRSILTLLAACGVTLMSFVATSGAFAESDPAAEAFLTSIYAGYKGNSDSLKGIRLDSEAAIRRYFDPALAEVMVKDAAEAKTRGEAPKLDRDPFIDGQDWEITKFAVAVKDAGADKAVGTVTINNFGKEIPLIVNLAKLPDGWRIANIMWERGDTLRGLYFKGEAPPPITKKPAAKAKKPPAKAAAKKPARREPKS